DRARDHADLFDSVTNGRNLRTGDQHGERLRDVLRGQAKRAGAVLVNDELQVRRLFVPVELRLHHVLVLPHDVTHLVGDVAHGVGVGADHAELHGETDRRTEIETVDAHARFAQIAPGDSFLQPRLDPLAGFDVLG